jgi:hypothetical protein
MSNPPQDSDLLTLKEALDYAFPDLTRHDMFDSGCPADLDAFDDFADKHKTCKYGFYPLLKAEVPCRAIRRDQIPLVFTDGEMRKLINHRLVGCKYAIACKEDNKRLLVKRIDKDTAEAETFTKRVKADEALLLKANQEIERLNTSITALQEMAQQYEGKQEKAEETQE